MAKKTASAKGSKKPAAKKETIGSVAIAALKAGKGAQGSLDAVLAKFPDAQTKLASIYWYASQEGIQLQGTAPKKEKKVHRVAVPAKKGGKKGPGPMVTKGKGGNKPGAQKVGPAATA